MFRIQQFITHRAAAFDLNHFVQFRDFAQQRGGEEVVAHRDTGGFAVFDKEEVL